MGQPFPSFRSQSGVGFRCSTCPSLLSSDGICIPATRCRISEFLRRSTCEQMQLLCKRPVNPY